MSRPRSVCARVTSSDAAQRKAKKQPCTRSKRNAPRASRRTHNANLSVNHFDVTSSAGILAQPSVRARRGLA
eukprot:8612311-Alexandrium_andersonii.AAC.1